MHVFIGVQDLSICQSQLLPIVICCKSWAWSTSAVPTLRKKLQLRWYRADGLFVYQQLGASAGSKHH